MVSNNMLLGYVVSGNLTGAILESSMGDSLNSGGDESSKTTILGNQAHSSEPPSRSWDSTSSESSYSSSDYGSSSSDSGSGSSSSGGGDF